MMEFFLMRSLYLHIAARIPLAAFAAVIVLAFSLRAPHVAANTITVPGTGTAGPAAPHPYIIPVFGTGTVISVTLSMTITHTYPDDLDILLRSPQGINVAILSDACGDTDLTNQFMFFSDTSAVIPPDEASCVGLSSVKPVIYDSSSVSDPSWNSVGIINLSFSALTGSNGNGFWELYVYDDAGSDTGSITNINLSVTGGSYSIVFPSSASTDGTGIASPYPYSFTGSGTGVIRAFDSIILANFYHLNMDDLDILLVSPSGTAVMLLSDGCGAQYSFFDLVFRDQPSDPLQPDSSGCSSVYRQPMNWGGQESLPPPAPPAPYFTSLSAFEGEALNGTWNLYIHDDGVNYGGEIFAFYPYASIVYAQTVSSMPTLLTNGNFGSGETGWQEFGGGTGSVSSGVYQFQRTSASDAFTVYQNTSAVFPANTPFEVRFQAGNTGAQRKRLTVVIWDSNFRRQRACSFWLAPNQPLTSYQILSDTTSDTINTWNNVTVHFYASSAPPAGNTGFYRLDNVVLRRRDDLTNVRETLCIDPALSWSHGGTDTGNLLNNGDFATLPGGNAEGAWARVGNINANLDNGAVRIQRTGGSGSNAGSLLQNTNVAFNLGDIAELSIDLGNSSANWQRATVLLHNESFAGLQFCTFWLPPNSPLSTYVIRTSANQAWDAQGISISLYPSTFDQWILVDNTLLRKRNGIKSTGAGCYEPGSSYPAGDLPFDGTAFGLDAPLQPTLIPTATAIPYSAPGMTNEQPLIAPFALPLENTMGEGTVSE
jgi:subtilisin-like proprotein convertase family protein